MDVFRNGTVLVKPFITLYLDIDPVAWPRPRFNKGRGFNTPKYEQFKKDVWHLARSQYHGKILSGSLKMEVIFYLRRPKSIKRKYPNVRPDLDNYLKAVGDALEGICFNDDAQIVTMSCSKMYATSGRIVVRLTPLT